MNIFRRFLWAWRFTRNVPSFRQFQWTKSDIDQTDAWLHSSTGMKVLAQLQNQVTSDFYKGADAQLPHITQQGLGIWRAVATIKILSEGEPTLANLSGIPAPARTQDAKDSGTDPDPLDHLYP